MDFTPCNIAKHWVLCKLNPVEANTLAKPSKAENGAFLKKEPRLLIFEKKKYKIIAAQAL
ncbi:MAG: hypothetical protein EOO96_07115 [Pedobacter sp.]|nr:MAG: hypothetical protein EOO96_07115 [Pedobacter sp.]